MSNVSIIILTFNSERFIKSCLGSVFSQDYHDFEVILVDNSSKDNTIAIACNYPIRNIIRNRENLGASKARNQGIEASGGKWVLTLDSDVVLEKGFLRQMVLFAERADSSVGMLQPRILQIDKKNIYSCGIKLTVFRRFYDIGKGRLNNGRSDFKKDVWGSSSAACFYRKDMLEAIKENTGYFDERFFFLVEDVDLAWRAQKKGWKATYHPEAVCRHYGNSSGFNDRTRQYLCFRNRYYMMIKNEHSWYLYARLLFSALYDVPRIFYLFLTNPHAPKAVKEVSSFKRTQRVH